MTSRPSKSALRQALLTKATEVFVANGHSEYQMTKKTDPVPTEPSKKKCPETCKGCEDKRRHEIAFLNATLILEELSKKELN